MKIVHIAPNSTFDDGWGFQDNLLPKYHAKLGNEVILLVNTLIHNGIEKIETEQCIFNSVDGFIVERFKYKKFFTKKLTLFFCKMDVYNRLVEIQPDLIFYHGLVSTTIFDVIKYKKQRRKRGKDCVIIQDNHLDYNIGIDPKTLKQKMLRTYYRLLNHISQKYVRTVFGVTPWRKTYASDFYKIAPKLTDVLIMGADDEKIDFLNKDKIRKELRLKYKIGENDFVIITGGKIDKKKKIHCLMEAVSEIKDVKLVIFGIVSEELQHDFKKMLDANDNIIYVGWIKSDEVYNYFFMSDLAFFPGQHSVLWEQACASKIPCVFARWTGMEHVNNGGNADFIKNDDVKTINEKIQELVFTEKYNDMKKVAMSSATDIYLYSEIAKKSLKDI